MKSLGIELSDAGLLAAQGDEAGVTTWPSAGAEDWPGFACAGERGLVFGRAAEDLWFVHPRRISCNFWSRLAHEPSGLVANGKPVAFSELAYFHLREFIGKVAASAPSSERVVLALPGDYLRDAATEEEKVGLVLGMVGELRLPVSGLVDHACAALCDPRGPAFSPSMPVLLVDTGLDGSDLTLLTQDGARLNRRAFARLPQSGLAGLLKQLTGSFGNRFLRHTTFDILEDGRIEQEFFRQLKDFLWSEAPEFRFVINTATRAYEMPAKHDQLASDAQSFTATLGQAAQAFLQRHLPPGSPFTLAVSDRAARVPGLVSRLRACGAARQIRLARGAAAAGAAHLARRWLRTAADLAEVPVETSVPRTEAAGSHHARARIHLHKSAGTASAPTPTHAILAGMGHPLGAGPVFTIGGADHRPHLELPPGFSHVPDCLARLTLESGSLWWHDASGDTPARVPVTAGDRLTFSSDELAAEVLFAHCPAAARG